MATVGVLVHEHRCCRVFAHLCTRLLAGIGQSALGVVHDQLFAKRIDKVLRATGDNELIGILLREHHGVADHIAPQAARRGDHHRIVLVRLYAPEGNNFGGGGVERNKLVEHIVVEHEHHRRVGKVVLQSEETLAGVIGLHIAHLRRADDLLILVAIGREGNAAVEKHLEVWPYLVEGVRTRQL